LSDGLTEDDAVKIALLNNRGLQASFEEIGIARADLVQAGFFTNPDLSALFRFPFGGGGSDIEAAGILKISDFWQIPVRKRVAAARFEMTMSKVSEEIIAAAAEAKHAHNEYVALSLMKTDLEKMKKQSEELREHIRYRETFGLAHELDVHAASADALDRQLELMRIESDLLVVRSRMNHAMGLSPDQDKYEVTGRLPEKFQPLPDLETLVSHACSARPDVWMAKKRIEESERILALEKKRIFRDVDSGLAYARDTDGTDLLGPEVKLQLPLFDQNQAQIAKAEYRTRQARKELQNRIGIVREEVSSALRKVLLSREEIALIRDMILPVRGEAVSYADAYVDAMQLNMLYALEARQKLFQTRRDLLQALREHRNQEIELERILGGKIPMPETESKVNNKKVPIFE
jgi:outer membrane protein TolC